MSNKTSNYCNDRTPDHIQISNNIQTLNNTRVLDISEIDIEIGTRYYSEDFASKLIKSITLSSDDPLCKLNGNLVGRWTYVDGKIVKD